MAIFTPVLGDGTAKDTVYTMTPTNSNLLPILLTQGITGPIIFQQMGRQRKFNITQKARSTMFTRTTDGNVFVAQTPINNWVGIEMSFVPTSPTVQTLSNLALLQDSRGVLTFSLNATSPTRGTTTQYPMFILLTPFSGFEENELTEDVPFEFAALLPNMVNVGALANAIGNII